VQSPDKTLASDLSSLAKIGRRERKRFETQGRDNRPVIPANVGTGFAEAEEASTGGSIASPLTETSRVETIASFTDSFGLWTIDVAFPSQVTMEDANTSVVIFNYNVP
jgi:hypothetical protein